MTQPTKPPTWVTEPPPTAPLTVTADPPRTVASTNEPPVIGAGVVPESGAWITAARQTPGRSPAATPAKRPSVLVAYVSMPETPSE
ncbi:MAG: hypothetical protein HYX53_01015 [Chloroflexi bacterium]|nr:hypothetical protein [Chloroflexota bacterium]